MKTLAILTSGGDAPGMNAAIRAATLFAHADGVRVLGIEDGYRGLMRGQVMELSAAFVAPISRAGGTVLGTTRAPEFLEPQAREGARRFLTDQGVDGLIVIGGNGSLTGAHELVADDPGWPCRVVGVPASIDNDVGMTGISIGVDTAMNTIVEACDRISDTARAHDRAFIVEVMGRHCGYLAMTAGVAAAADTVLFPEANRSEDDLVQSVARTILSAQERPGDKRVLIVKAEGVSVPTDRLRERVDEVVAAARAVTHPDAPPIETRATVLGHVVRGGRPSAFDRLVAGRLAHVAYRALTGGGPDPDGAGEAGVTDVMAAWLVPGDTASPGVRPSAADPYCRIVDLPAMIAETARLLDGTSPIARWRRHVFEDIEGVLGGWSAV